MKTPPVRSIAEVRARFAVSPDATLGEVAKVIEANGEGVAVVLGAGLRFLGIVTDGDIRRAFLAGTDLGTAVRGILKRKSGPAPEKPLTAPPGAAEGELIARMDRYRVRHMPLVGDDGRIAGLALISELGRRPPMRAVIMAGGFGKRVRPLTDDTPKPLLKVGHKPVIEHIMHQLRNAGVENVSVTTHYLADRIKAHLGDGSEFGINVRYTYEQEPLGTAGALSMLAKGDEPTLVVNGDILTEVDFRAMFEFHRENEAELTVGVRKYEFSVPFGVVEADGARVMRLREKPSLSFFINAGIYLLEPAVVREIPKAQKLDMTDLIEARLNDGAAVCCFPIHEYWTDIGGHQDLLKARKEAGDLVWTEKRIVAKN